MKIAVFGSTGLTGRAVTEQALAAGDQVVALVRNPGTVGFEHPNLEIRQGSPTSSADVDATIRGVDAVVHCLGVGGKGDGKPTTLVSDSVRAVLAAMDHNGVARIVCMSNVGADGSGLWAFRRIVVPVFARWVIPIVEDKERMEAALRASDAEWVAVRMAKIVDGPVKPVRTSSDGRGIGLTVTAASAAKFLLEQTRGSEFLRTTPALSN